MIDPPDRSNLQSKLTAALDEYDARHGPAVTRWQRFRRWRFRRLLMRRLYDRHALRHS